MLRKPVLSSAIRISRIYSNSTLQIAYLILNVAHMKHNSSVNYFCFDFLHKNYLDSNEKFYDLELKIE